MSGYKKKQAFLDSEEGLEIKQLLQGMVQDSAYQTGPSYSANTTLHPDNLVSFVDKHLDYLQNHPATNPQHYIANLRLMTRLK